MPSHPTDTCTVSPAKVAPGAPPTMAPPSYHPYRMPMVQNDYIKVVENIDMPPPVPDAYGAKQLHQSGGEQ